MQGSRYFNYEGSFFSITPWKIEVHHVSLDDRLFRPELFQQTLYLKLRGTIERVDGDLFKSFQVLRALTIQTTFMRNLFSNGLGWMTFINSGVNITDLNNETQVREYGDQDFILVLHQNFKSFHYYTYPDEDFCLFADFPHERLVLPKLDPGQSILKLY